MKIERVHVHITCATLFCARCPTSMTFYLCDFSTVRHPSSPTFQLRNIPSARHPICVTCFSLVGSLDETSFIQPNLMYAVRRLLTLFDLT